MITFQNCSAMSFIRLVNSYQAIILFLIFLNFLICSVFTPIIEDHQPAAGTDLLNYRIPLFDYRTDIFFFVVRRHNNI